MTRKITVLCRDFFSPRGLITIFKILINASLMSFKFSFFFF